MKKIFILIVVLFIAIVFAILLRNKNNDNTQKEEMVVNKNNISPQTPFEEMSIPYLQQKEYQSKIGNMEKINENQAYTSYLTNYISDGFNINGLLTIPKEDMPEKGFPAIVFVHGYIPPKQYKTLQKYEDYVDYLAKNGFVVFKIDLRGHGESGGEATGAYFSADYVIDTLNARSALQKSDFVDEGSVGLWGHSMAGNVLLRSMVVKPDIPAISIWAGAVYTYEDLAKYRIQDSSYVRTNSLTPNSQNQENQTRQILRDFLSDNTFPKELVPTNYLNGVQGAVQLNHAIDDSVVSIEYSRDLNKLLNETNIPHELNEYQTGGHNISGASFNSAMQNTVEFFNKNLKK